VCKVVYKDRYATSDITDSLRNLAGATAACKAGALPAELPPRGYDEP
jgi:hypothetical protein